MTDEELAAIESSIAVAMIDAGLEAASEHWPDLTGQSMAAVLNAAISMTASMLRTATSLGGGTPEMLLEGVEIAARALRARAMDEEVH